MKSAEKKQTAQVLVAGNNTALKLESSRYLQLSLIIKLFVPDFFSQLLGREGLGGFCM